MEYKEFERIISAKRMDKKKRDKFVRYSEGAQIYHMSQSKFMQLAKDAKEQGMLFLLLTGGEPFLYPEFKELYQELSAMGFVISINSGF